MKDDEGAIDLLALQTIEQVVTDIDGNHVDTSAGQRVDHCCAGFQRHLTLGTLATVEHGDAAKVFHSNSGVQFFVGVHSHFDFP
ncbi:hypothetical protein D3C78_1762250 [compost metagenome]